MLSTDNILKVMLKFVLKLSSTLVVYFTPDSLDGIEMDFKNGSTLECLFKKSGSLCFDNLNSAIGCHDFSPFSKNIFVWVFYNFLVGTYIVCNLSENFYHVTKTADLTCNRKILIIGFRQGEERGRYFRFDPSSILVRYLDKTVLEVGVPTSQLVNTDGDGGSYNFILTRIKSIF